MKRKYYKLKHNREIIFSLLILIIIITINIGFSAFGSNLYIGDISLNVRIESDIRVTGIEIDNTLNSGISNYEEYDVNSVSASISLPNEESSVTYKVNITNIGNVEMGILNITGLPETLDYELTDYTLKDKLCNSDDNTKCTLGSITYFYITIKYKDDSYDSDNLNYNFTLNFDFKKFYTITYDNITNNGYPEEILEGDNLEITFITDVPNSLSVTMNNITLTQNTDYTYNDNTLIINDIDGDIVINSYYSADSSNISSIIDSLDENGGYIVLTDSISLEGSLTFDSGGDVTLDLSNSTISNSTLSNGDKLIVISGSTNLTITGDSDNSISSNEIGIYMDSTFTGTVTLSIVFENVTNFFKHLWDFSSDLVSILTVSF